MTHGEKLWTTIGVLSGVTIGVLIMATMFETRAPEKAAPPTPRVVAPPPPPKPLPGMAWRRVGSVGEYSPCYIYKAEFEGKEYLIANDGCRITEIVDSTK